MKCDMHACWEAIYEWSYHAHRDPVANVVIYAAIAFFMGFVSLAFGLAAYLLIDIPCGLGWTAPEIANVTNDVIEASVAVDPVPTLDTCHVIIPLCIAGKS